MSKGLLREVLIVDLGVLQEIFLQAPGGIIDMGGDKALLRPVRGKGYLFAAPLVVRNRD